MKAVQLIALVHKHRGKSFCSISRGHDSLHKIGYLLDLPPEIIGYSYSGVGASVAHRNENIVFAQLYLGFVYLLSVDIQLGFRIIVIPSVTKHNHARIVILHYLRHGIVDEVYDRKRGVCDTANRAYWKSCGNRGNAFLKGKPLRHHRGDYL